MNPRPAPDFHVTRWLNTPSAPELLTLKGRVVMILAFQMLCPGCAVQALPQARRVRTLFKEEDLMVLGLHTVFEHHEAQGPEAALKAFLHEHRIDFPVGIDAPGDNAAALPLTMQHYRMQGTPTLILLDRLGHIRKHRFGHTEDLLLGAEIMSLIQEPPQHD
ncbi:peroxiredoxin family protein [Oceanicaulis sp.]|uniref:peroxiredoxin family protein n=1 Tax=Oceanicaulis sp. TaxID=1924941 RepID=UPI003D2A29A7